MNVKVKSRGSTADMLDAFQMKLDDLNGNVESCIKSDDEVESSCDKYDKVESCGDYDKVESCGNNDVESSCDKYDEVNSCDDNIYSDDELDDTEDSDYLNIEDDFNYIMDVFDEVSDELMDDGAENVDYSMEEQSMVIYFSIDDDIYDVDVPFSDITGNFDKDVKNIYQAATDFD